MDPLWAALAGLLVGIGYAAISQRVRSRRPQVTPAQGLLDSDTVEEINDLVVVGKPIRAIKVLRQHTGLSLLDGKNRIDDWQVEHERALARSD